MQKKTVLIITAGIIIVGIGLTVVLFLSNNKDEQPVTPTSTGTPVTAVLAAPWNGLPDLTGMSESDALQCKSVIGSEYYWDVSFSAYTQPVEVPSDAVRSYTFRLDNDVFLVWFDINDNMSYQNLGQLSDAPYSEIQDDTHQLTGIVDITPFPDDVKAVWSDLAMTYTPLEDLFAFYNALRTCNLETETLEMIYEAYPENVETYFHAVINGLHDVKYYQTGDTWAMDIQ